ncbi:MAG: hypothetical protein R3F43_09045 [bacterium]
MRPHPSALPAIVILGGLLPAGAAFGRDEALDVGVSAGYVCAAATRRFHGAGATADAVFQLAELIAVRGPRRPWRAPEQGRVLPGRAAGRGATAAPGRLRVRAVAGGRPPPPTSPPATSRRTAPSARRRVRLRPAPHAPPGRWASAAPTTRSSAKIASPRTSTSGLRVGYRWVFGDPFAP